MKKIIVTLGKKLRGREPRCGGGGDGGGDGWLEDLFPICDQSQAIVSFSRRVQVAFCLTVDYNTQA